MIDICAVGLMIGMSGVVHGHVKRPQSVGCPVQSLPDLAESMIWAIGGRTLH